MHVARMILVVLCATVFATAAMIWNQWQGRGSKEARLEIVKKDHWHQRRNNTSGDDAADNQFINLTAGFVNESNNEMDKPSANKDIADMNHRQHSTNNAGADSIIIKSITHYVDSKRIITESSFENNKTDREEMNHESSLKKRKLKVDVYGGSIATGGGLHDRYSSRFSALLDHNFPELEVTNKGR